MSENDAVRRLLVGSEFFRSAGEDIPVTALDNLVGVSLLGEEQLAVHGEFLFLGILRDDAVEVRGTAVALGPEHAAETLGFFLAASEGSGNLDEHVRVGKVDGEVADLRNHEVLEAPVAEGAVELFAFLVRGLARNQRGRSFRGSCLRA